jgi:hypothetical protein
VLVSEVVRTERTVYVVERSAGQYEFRQKVLNAKVEWNIRTKFRV